MKNEQKLKVIAAGDREILVTREFNAPRELVFKALTTPDILRQWFGGPIGWHLVVCEIDARAGGVYRYVWRNGEGMEMGMGGVFLEFAVPERLVTTENFYQSWYPGEAVGTIVLSENHNRTILSLRISYDSQEARDMVLRSPMDQGMAVGYDRLDSYLQELQEQVNAV